MSKERFIIVKLYSICEARKEKRCIYTILQQEEKMSLFPEKRAR
jgi:hypothetical protein